MKRFKVTIAMLLALLLLLPAPFAGTLNSQSSGEIPEIPEGFPEIPLDFDWGLFFPEGDEDPDWLIELPDADVVCSTTSYGMCYRADWIWKESTSIFGHYGCVWTGLRHNCSHLLIKILNLFYITPV